MVYSLPLTYYNDSMNEKHLTIEQVEIIMGWSYPTALRFASRFGEMRGRKWHVPSNIVANEIAKRDVEVVQMKKHFSKIVTAAEPAAAK